jgi:hypothetical protein
MIQMLLASDELDIFRLKFQNIQMLEAVSKSCYSELIGTGVSELEQDSIVLSISSSVQSLNQGRGLQLNLSKSAIYALINTSYPNIWSIFI